MTVVDTVFYYNVVLKIYIEDCGALLSQFSFCLVFKNVRHTFKNMMDPDTIV